MLLALATTYCAGNGFPFAFVHNWIMVNRDAYCGGDLNYNWLIYWCLVSFSMQETCIAQCGN
jgi:hypothetical protein